MEIDNSSYEDAESKLNNNINNNNIYNSNKVSFESNGPNYNNLNIEQKKFYNNYSNSKNINQNERYNNSPENNEIENNIGINNSEVSGDYVTPRENEILFERENKSSYCSTCKCEIF